MSFLDDSVLRRVVVQVKCGESVIGSGCIVPSSRSDGQFYCLTARHCIEQKNFELFLRSDGGELEPLLYDNTLLDEHHDAAIIRVHYPAWQYPKDVYIGKLNSSHDEVTLVGYPLLRKGDISCITASFSHSDLPGKSEFYIHLKDIHTFTAELSEQVRGISGGGCFSLDGSHDCKLLGVETGFVDNQQSFGEIVCLNLNVFEELLQKNGWTELERPKYRYSSLSWKCGRNVLDKRDEDENYDSWIDTDASVNLIHEIQEHLLSNNDNTPLLLSGFSGIGKTRTTLQACTQNSELSNALIFDSFDDFSSVQQELRSYLRSTTDEPIYLIVDNIKFDDWYDLKAFIKPHKNAHIVAIAEMGKEPERNDFPMLRMEPYEEEDVVRIIQKLHPSLDDEDLHAIFRLSDNDLRFALLIAYTFERAPDRIEWNIRGMTSDTTSAKRIVDRIMSQIDTISDDNSIKIFSLFVDFGYQETGRRELEFLCQYFQLSPALLERKINLCLDHHLGIHKGFYFELSPRALARFLFSEYFATLIPDFSDFMEQIPTHEMRIRFFERARECGDMTWEEVKGALAPWFRSKYGKTRWEIFPRLGGSNTTSLTLGDDALFPIREALIYVEYVPEEGLQWLYSLIVTAGDEILKTFSGYSSGRREIVWTCEHLACFHEHFEKCEEILFHLALNETEHRISNNSRGVWSNLFGLIQSNTEVPFEDRFHLLLHRMEIYQSEWETELFDQALSAALSWSGMRLLPPKMIGGRLTPQNWAESHIQTLSDFVNMHRNILSDLYRGYDSLPPSMRQVVFQRLKTEMVTYTSPLICSYAPILCDEYRKTLERFAETLDDRVEIMIEIEKQLFSIKVLQDNNEEGDKGIPNQLPFLRQWHDFLSDMDFISRLKVLLSKNLYLSEKEVLPELTNAATSFLKLEDPQLALSSIISIRTWNENTLGRFAEIVGKLDINYKLMPMAEKMFAAGKNTFSLDYFRGVCSREQSIPNYLQEVLDRCLDCNPCGVMRMSVTNDISDSGLRRVLILLERGEIDNSVLGLSDQRWLAVISRAQAEKVLTLLLANEVKESIYCFLFLSKEWIKVFQEPAFTEFLLLQTAKIPTAELRQYSFAFVPLLEQMSTSYLLDCLILAIRSLDYGNIRGIPREQYNYIKAHSNGPFSLEIANEICDCILEHSKNLVFGISCASIVQLLAASHVLGWIGEDEKTRAKLIAYNLPAPFLKEVFVPSVTLAVLEKYHSDESVFRNFLAGIHAFEFYDYNEVAQNWDTTRAVLEEYATYPSKAIQRWAEYELNRIKGILGKKQIMESEESRFEE